MTHPIFDTNKQYNRERIIKDLDTRDATIEAQAQTIERLADALEFALAYADVTDEGQANWQKYTAKRWPNGLNVGQLHDALTAARALLAEIRGAK